MHVFYQVPKNNTGATQMLLKQAVSAGNKVLEEVEKEKIKDEDIEDEAVNFEIDIENMENNTNNPEKKAQIQSPKKEKMEIGEVIIFLNRCLDIIEKYI